MIDLFSKYGPLFIDGLKYTLGLSLISVLVGTIIALALAFFRLSKVRVLNLIGTVYVEIFRGTPLMAQLLIVKFGFYDFITKPLGLEIPNLALGVIAVSLNSAAYVCEVLRAGIESIDKGQMEAGRSLGMNHSMTMKLIILPQAIKNILPALCNEFIAVIKETSIISYIGVTDLFYMANIVGTQSYRYFDSIMIIAVIYFIITFTLSKLVRLLERRLSQSDNR